MTAALAVGAMALAAAQAAEAPGNAARGKQLFHDHGCYGCHGYNGETGARDLVGTGSPIVSDETLFRYFLRLRGDQAPDVPAMTMPNFPKEALGDADVHDLFAYVRSFRLNAPKVEDTPTLRRILELAARPVSAASTPPSSAAPGKPPGR
jgi:mono/diheme cytochrome c family protein